jgi:trans-aconitate 2-methyltransferase
LIDPFPNGRVVDLGCGSGELTAELHEQMGGAETLGIDRSASMLAQAPSAPGLRFEQGDLATFSEPGWDLIFSNAAFHWVPDHPGLLRRLRGLLTPGGQLAFQIPANFDHTSHVVAARLARSPEFARDFAGGLPEIATPPVLAPERYAEILDGLGASELHVRLQVYGHHLESADAVVDWAHGTLLTAYRAAMAEDRFDQYLAEYRRRLGVELGDARPFLFTFKRILARARFDGPPA